MAYYVSYSACTHVEPSPGWYYTATTEDGEEEIRGPFPTKTAALDDESDGAYSSYLADYAREDREAYRQDMRDAGRGHLLRED